MAILLHPDGSSLDVFPGDGQRFTLQELQAHVGGYIEPVNTLIETEFNGYTIQIMYVNEDGRMQNLEYNLNASMIAGQHIVGNALVLFQGEQEEEDEE
jgi:hypothetical protein